MQAHLIATTLQRRHPVVLAIVLGVLFGSPAWGERLYRLHELPAWQAGYRLSGQILVDDNAAADGLLQQDEVLGWSWSAKTDEPTSIDVPYAGSLPNDLGGGSTTAEGLLITDDAIYLPTDRPAHLGLVSLTAPSRGQSTYRLRWTTAPDFEDPEVLATQYLLTGTFEGDIGVQAWISTLPTGTGALLRIATAVPESESLFLLATGLLCFRRRLFAAG